MQSKAATVAEYLASLPEDRRIAVEAVRKVFKQNLAKGFEEGMQYGMIGYYVPHTIYPAGYHCDPKQPLPFACLASQKQGISVYLHWLYADPVAAERFVAAWKATGKKLDMGKSCLRFKRLEDAALEPIGAAIKAVTVKEYIARYESVRAMSGTASAKKSSKQGAATQPVAAQAATAKTSAAKKKAAAKTVTKKPAAKSAAARRPALGKPASKKPASKKPTSKKSTSKKSSAR